MAEYFVNNPKLGIGPRGVMEIEETWLTSWKYDHGQLTVPEKGIFRRYKTECPYSYHKTMVEGSPRGIVAKVSDCDIIINEFKLQLHYYIHFWTYTTSKGMKPLISQLWAK